MSYCFLYCHNLLSIVTSLLFVCHNVHPIVKYISPNVKVLLTIVKLLMIVWQVMNECQTFINCQNVMSCCHSNFSIVKRRRQNVKTF